MQMVGTFDREDFIGGAHVDACVCIVYTCDCDDYGGSMRPQLRIAIYSDCDEYIYILL